MKTISSPHSTAFMAPSPCLPDFVCVVQPVQFSLSRKIFFPFVASSSRLSCLLSLSPFLCSTCNVYGIQTVHSCLFFLDLGLSVFLRLFLTNNQCYTTAYLHYITTTRNKIALVDLEKFSHKLSNKKMKFFPKKKFCLWLWFYWFEEKNMTTDDKAEKYDDEEIYKLSIFYKWLLSSTRLV